ncbi:MAG: endonuclease/exonuclease/phosphatase family protein [Bacteroidota bacterium]
MRKALHSILVITLIVLGALFLVGKYHFLLGSLLGLFQWPIIIIAGLILWRKRKTGLKNIHKILLVVTTLLLLNWGYEQARRIGFEGVAGTEKEVSILTYNLFFKNTYPQQILNEINSTDADILIVQELTSKWNDHLSRQVYSKYPFRKTYIHNGTHGLGILSKYPIRSCTYLKNGRGLPVSQISAFLINGKELVVANSHFASPAIAVENPENFFSLYQQNFHTRNEQWESLQGYLQENHLGVPQVVSGDLNTMKIDPLYREIRYTWKDLHAGKGTGLGWNFPNVSRVPFPLITLDYILYRGNIKPLESKVLPGSSSDHLAIFGRIEL